MPERRFERAARQILARLELSGPPIPIEEVASAEGAIVVRNHFQGYESGFALRDSGRWYIGVNTATSPRRQRFTIAHELGHLLLHEGKPLITDYSVVLVNRRDDKSSLGTEEEEIEANGFAAAILMPRSLVIAELKAELERGTATSRDVLIARLAKAFDVSNEAMGYRLVNLNIITA